MYFDQYTDVDEQFLKKVASVPLLENVEELPNRDFALIIKGKQSHRQFPLKDARSTMLSLLYFLKNIKRMPKEYVLVTGPRIKEALIRFNLPVPDALRNFPVGCEGFEVEKVAAAPSPKRMVKTAAPTVRTPNPSIERDVRYFVRHLEEEKQEPYVKLAGMVKEGSVAPALACEAFEALNERNQINDYKRRYSPDELVYGVEKTASSDFFVKVAEESISDALQSDHAAKIKEGLKEHLDEEVIEGLFENPDVVFSSLPTPHQDVIRSVIEQWM